MGGVGRNGCDVDFLLSFLFFLDWHFDCFARDTFLHVEKEEREKPRGVVAGTRKGKRTHVPSASSLIMRTCLRSRYREFPSTVIKSCARIRNHNYANNIPMGSY